MLSSITNDIASIERTNNVSDAHVECSSFRMKQDNKDLAIIAKALREEHIFEENNVHGRKIMNGKSIHEKIIENFVTMYERGLQKMNLSIQERYIDWSVTIDDRLSDMIRSKLSDPYVLDDGKKTTKKVNNDTVMAKIIKTADIKIKDILSLSCFRVSLFLTFFSVIFSFFLRN